MTAAAPEETRGHRAALSPSDDRSAVDLARDRALVERCQRGDRGAFDELYRRYHRRLVRFCMKRLGDSDDAEDSAQESFTKAWRALPNFSGERRFYPWLTVIAANCCTDTLRRRARLTPMGEVDGARLERMESLGATTEEGLVDGVDGAIAVEALGQLSPRHRRVLALREASGWSARRIADHEGLSVPVVETLLWRARRALQREFAALVEAGGGLGAALLVAGAVLRRFVRRTANRLGRPLIRPQLAGQAVRTTHLGALPGPLGGLPAAVLGGAVVVGGISLAVTQIPPLVATSAPLSSSAVARGTAPNSGGPTGTRPIGATGHGRRGAIEGSRHARRGAASSPDAAITQSAGGPGPATASTSSPTAGGGSAGGSGSPPGPLAASPSSGDPSSPSASFGGGTLAGATGTTPSVTAPSLGGPSVTTPSVATPGISAPAVSPPAVGGVLPIAPVTVPPVTVPPVTVPSITGPSGGLPSISVPSVSIPSVNLPSTPVASPAVVSGALAQANLP